MKKYLLVFISMALLFSFAGCDSASTAKDKPTDGSDVVTEPDQSHEFGLANQENNLVLKKDILGQELVLMPTLVEVSAPTTATDVFATKLVYFEQREESIYLMEVMEGRTITDPYEPVSILAQFPIVGETAGFDALIVNYGDFMDADLPDSSLPITASYLENWDSNSNSFAFDHVAQVSVPGFFGGNTLRTVRFTYNFVPSERDLISELLPDEEDRFGFFLTRPTYERATGEPHKVVHRWDPSKPILFHISANTPADYIDYVKQGVLAWNKAFDAEVIKVKNAPEGVISGTPGYNVIQWVGFDEAPGAYTIWHAHPRTGQILDANVIMTSVFAVKSKDSAKRMLEILDEKTQTVEIEEDKEENHGLAIGLSGFEANQLCDNRFEKSGKEFLQLAASGQFSDSDILKMSQLFVRSIVMHEVGHALGLRHNFHGNLGSQISAANDEQNLRDVINGNVQEDALPSASIMDYLHFQDSIRMHKPGRYDQMAISWAYNLGDPNLTNPPPFCTDHEIRVNADCKPFDGGAEPIYWYNQKKNDFLAYLSSWLNDTVLDEIERTDEQEPARHEYIYYLARLMDYLNEAQNVLDLPGASAEARRVRAAEVIAEILRTSDEAYDAVVSLVSAKLKTKLQELSADDESKQEIMAEIQNLRDTTVAYIFDRLYMLLGPSMPIRPGLPQGFEQVNASASRINQSKEMVTPLAHSLAGIAVNHVAVDQPAEPMELRFGAARLINDFQQGLIEEIKNQAVAKLEANIVALENALLAINDPDEQQRYEQLIYDEEEILFILSGRPRFDLPAHPLEDEDHDRAPDDQENNYAQVN